MPIPDAPPLTAAEWQLLIETVSEAAAQALSYAGDHSPGTMHRLLTAQAAALETLRQHLVDLQP